MAEITGERLVNAVRHRRTGMVRGGPAQTRHCLSAAADMKRAGFRRLAGSNGDNHRADRRFDWW